MREIPEAHLLILGSGPYESNLYKLARQLGVLDRVSIKHSSVGRPPRYGHRVGRIERLRCTVGL